MTLTLAPAVVLPDKLKGLLAELHGWHYLLGAKISPLSQQSPTVTGTAENGSKGFFVDCSGFVLWALYHLTGGTFSRDPEDVNSADLHAIIAGVGFVPVPPAAGHIEDGALRIWFLTPEQGNGIGHVLLTCEGMTYESHGSKGPDSRAWGSQPWMGTMQGYELTEAA